MPKRFIAIWFRYLKTDWLTRRHPALKEEAFVLAVPDHGRMIVTAANAIAEAKGVNIGMVLADARAIVPSLVYFDDQPERPIKLLKAIAEWCIRYTPAVAIDPPEGLFLDISGCAHLWGGEKEYMDDIRQKLAALGYDTLVGMADTPGCAWAVARFGRESQLVKIGGHLAAMLPLPAPALRLEAATVERLEKLGFRQISDFINIPRPALRRRFGPGLIRRINQAIGGEQEPMELVQPLPAYLETLPCLEPIITAAGIGIALKQLLEQVCNRLKQEQKGLKAAAFKCYRLDGRIEKVSIGTIRGSVNETHLFRLFEIKIPGLAPGPGIDLFTLEAGQVEELRNVQENLWEANGSPTKQAIAELLDRISGKMGSGHIHRYLPAEHHWPERSFRSGESLGEEISGEWKLERPRPLRILPVPEPIQVTAPIPDYPPMLFRYAGSLHKIIKADGPERIEQEWWLEEGRHRDYYAVEDEEGRRYWLFRSGHYDAERSYGWFIHGFFA
jgi:protein ImuB